MTVSPCLSMPDSNGFESLNNKAKFMNILLVEDDPIVADVLAMTLEDAGYFTIIAGSIHEALEELNINETKRTKVELIMNEDITDFVIEGVLNEIKN